MSAAARVTVVCATRNARPSVRLTFASFRRHTPQPCTVLVADNGSTDATLEDLSMLPWLTVVPLEERRARMEAAAKETEALIAGLERRLERYAARLNGRERVILQRIRASGRLSHPPVAGAALTEHGATLDWLADHVETPLFVTLDSDVEFLESNWLSEMIELMEDRRLAALGVHEPGDGGYHPRLAPYLLMLRTDVFRALNTSFRAFIVFGSDAEARRWAMRPRSLEISRRERLAAYPTTRFYSTGAALFERLKAAGMPWLDLPPAIARKARHHGHMSWATASEDHRAAYPARFEANTGPGRSM